MNSKHNEAKTAEPTVLEMYREALNVSAEDPETADRLALTAEEHAHAQQNSVAVANIRLLRAFCLQRLGKPQAAYAVLLDALPQFREIGDITGECNTLKLIGEILLETADYKAAMAKFKKSLSLAGLLDDIALSSSINVSIGRCYNELTFYTEALDYYKRALEGFRSLEAGNPDRSEGETVCLNNIACVYWLQKEYDRAVECLQHVMALADETGLIQARMNAGNILGAICRDQGELSRSEQLHQESLAIARRTGGRYPEADTLHFLARLALLQTHYARAREYAEQSMLLAREIGARNLLRDALLTLSEIHEHLGDWTQALECHKLYHEQDRTISQASRENLGLHIEKDKLQRDAERAAARNDFVLVTAHDFTNPLEAVLADGQNLLDNFVMLSNRDIVQSSQRIVQNARKALDRSRQLLALYEVEGLPDKIKLQECDFRVCAEKAIGELGPKARSKSILVRSRLPKYPCMVKADKERLTSVIEHLLINAIKYAPHDSVVSLLVETQGPILRMEIHDQGPGVPAEEMPRLFERHFKGVSQPTGGETSSGVGLYIVRRIVGVFSGRVWCESSVGRGACFLVELPLLAGAGEESASHSE